MKFKKKSEFRNAGNFQPWMWCFLLICLLADNCFTYILWLCVPHLHQSRNWGVCLPISVLPVETKQCGSPFLCWGLQSGQEQVGSRWWQELKAVEMPWPKVLGEEQQDGMKYVVIHFGLKNREWKTESEGITASLRERYNQLTQNCCTVKVDVIWLLSDTYKEQNLIFQRNIQLCWYYVYF